MEIRTLPPYNSQPSAISQYFSDIEIGDFLETTGRVRQYMPNDRNNSGFYALLYQTGFIKKTGGGQDLISIIHNLKKERLELPMDASFDSEDTPRFANIFGCPIVEVALNAENRLVEITVNNPAFGLPISFTGDSQLSENFVQNCRLPQRRIDNLSQWWNNLPGPMAFVAATSLDVVRESLEDPNTIVLIKNPSGQFDAAPHTSRLGA
jgi:hypothetical protein